MMHRFSLFNVACSIVSLAVLIDIQYGLWDDIEKGLSLFYDRIAWSELPIN
jgi:hypothetical protein